MDELHPSYNNRILWMDKRDHLLRMRIEYPPSLAGQVKPGQFLALGLANYERMLPNYPLQEMSEAKRKRLVKRPYSISHPILNEGGELILDEPDFLEFYISLVQPPVSSESKVPQFTPRLFCLDSGFPIHANPRVAGDYLLDIHEKTQRIFFFSTGTGEAPHNAMIHSLLLAGFKGDIFHLVCNPTMDHFLYYDIYRSLEFLFPNFHYFPLSRESRTFRGEVQRFQGLISQGLLESEFGLSLECESDEVFLCGNPSMIGTPKKCRESGLLVYPEKTGLVELLMRRGFSHSSEKCTGNIHYESYW